MEIGERFKVQHFGEKEPRKDVYAFESNRLSVVIGYYGGAVEETLRALLSGAAEIVKLPFEPQYGEDYWTVCWEIGCRTRELLPAKFAWLFDYDDMLRKKLNIVYRTKAEAEKNMVPDYERITGHKWEEAFELGVMRYENEKNTETAQMDN